MLSLHIRKNRFLKIALESTLQNVSEDTVFVAMYGGFNQIGRTGLLLNEAACKLKRYQQYILTKISARFLF